MVVLLNVLIAIVSDSYDKGMADAVLLYHSNRYSQVSRGHQGRRGRRGRGERKRRATLTAVSSRLGKRLAKVNSPTGEGSKTGDESSSAGSLSASSGSEKGNKRQRVSRSPLPQDRLDVELNNNLKDEFKCAVCQDFFIESTTLNCGHITRGVVETIV